MCDGSAKRGITLSFLLVLHVGPSQSGCSLNACGSFSACCPSGCSIGFSGRSSGRGGVVGRRGRS